MNTKMKNTTGLKEDGSRWSMLNGFSEMFYFKSWGATDIMPIPDSMANGRNSGRDKVFIILQEDGWHYAHTDGTSCYCAPKSFQCPSWESAWFAHELNVATNKRKSAEKELESCLKIESKAQNSYASSLAVCDITKQKTK